VSLNCQRWDIIQLIAEKVKREIEESLIKVIEGEVNLDNIVDSVGEMHPEDLWMEVAT